MNSKQKKLRKIEQSKRTKVATKQDCPVMIAIMNHPQYQEMVEQRKEFLARSEAYERLLKKYSKK